MNARTEDYKRLLEDINKMISDQERGYTVAQSMNDQFWEDLGTHRQRMQEQIKTLESKTQPLEEEMRTAESVYEATRNYISKFK